MGKSEVIYECLRTRKAQYVMFVCALVAIFIPIFAMNIIYLPMLDDWGYSFIFETTTMTRRVTSLGDIVESQYNHYNAWGGRSVVHSIDQALLMLQPIWQDVLNTLAFVILLILMYKIANNGRSINVFVFIITALAVWLYIPEFGATLFWLTGSANYLWGTLLVLVFIYPYFAYYQTEDNKNKQAAKAVGMFILGILAGWTNENTGFAMICLLIGLMIVFRLQKIKIPIWAIAGLIGAVIGYIVMVKAPGNYQRYAIEMKQLGGDANNLFSISSLPDRLSGIWRHYRKTVIILLVLDVFLFALYLWNSNKGRSRTKVMTSSLLFFAAGHIAIFVMMASPICPRRTLFGGTIFIIISIAVLIANTDLKSSKYNSLLNAVLVIITISLIAYAAFDYNKKYKVVHQCYTVISEREAYMNKQKDRGQKDFVFTGQVQEIKGWKSDYYFYDVSQDSSQWLNTIYAQYMGVNSIIVLPQSEQKNN